MPFRNFSDFKQRTGDELLPTDFLVGYRDLVSEYRTTIADLTIEILKNINLQTAPEVLYVNTRGKDTNTGRSEFNAFRTIKRAAAKALEISRNTMTADSKQREQALGIIGNFANPGQPLWGVLSRQVNIFVRTGDYIEDNPIYLPPSCTVIGDNLRSTTIIPRNKFYDIFWVNNRCYVWGITFRKHKAPGFAIAYPSLRYLSGGPIDLSNNFLTPEGSVSLLPPNLGAELYYKIDPGTGRYILDKNSYPGERLRSSIETTQNWFNLYKTDQLTYNQYNVTRVGTVDSTNLSLFEEASLPIFDPARIAFLDRYFKNLGERNQPDPLFTEEELENNYNFDETVWYRDNVKRPYQLTSPYTQGCSSITESTTPGADDAGGGIIVDGERVDGPLRSMVTDSFTQFNEGGKGIFITNNGYAQLVSTFTICCTEGVSCDFGGTCSINTSNCSFGLSGLVARGRSPRPVLIAEIAEDIPAITDTIKLTKINASEFINAPGNVYDFDKEFKNSKQPYPGHVFYIELPNGESITNTDLTTGLTSFFSIISAQSVIEGISNTIYPGNQIIPGGGYDCNVQLEQNYFFRLDKSYVDSVFFTENPDRTVLPKGSIVRIYIRSTVTTSSHTMEYIGTGTTLLSSVPQYGGLPKIEQESIFDGVGRVFFTSTNHLGDFRVGPGLTIVQSTGTIEGETFERSILQITTPISITIGGF